MLAKEAAEARARLRELPSNEPQRPKAVGGDIRRRQLGDIAAILGGRPSKRRKTEERRTQEGRRVNTSSEDEAKPEEKHRPERRESSRREDKDDSRKSRSHRERLREKDGPLDLAKQIEERRRRHRSRSRSPRERSSKESRHRHRSPRRGRSRSPENKKSREKSRRSHRERSISPRKSRISEADMPVKKPSQDVDTKMGYDSDPLDDIIGPRPPSIPEVRTRGRGTISTASGIDSRFSANYDPTTDVELALDEKEDWDQALETFRDRQKWKQQGADRLKAAGFTDGQIEKWEKGGEKREEDVKWAKKGEGREWDRGKVVDEIGDVGIESGFGRLKDT